MQGKTTAVEDGRSVVKGKGVLALYFSPFLSFRNLLANLIGTYFTF